MDELEELFLGTDDATVHGLGFGPECNRGVEISSTPMGRRRKLPVWINSGDPAHTAAKNSPVQGAGADAIKLTMARLFEDRQGGPGNPRLNASVHDEVVLSVEAEHAEEAVEWVRSHMAAAEREAVGDPNRPIVIDVEAKDSWA
jgi:DNA polymerase-1